MVNSMPYRGVQILGHAQFPGGKRTTDGVVLAAPFVGRNQRTATHEVGHWLNLRHIWGDGTNMTTNFMDYSDDTCMYMFTEGQKDRMDAIFAPGGFRAAMAD